VSADEQWSCRQGTGNSSLRLGRGFCSFYTKVSRLNYSGTANVVQGAVPNWDKGGPSTHAKAPPEMRGDPDAPAQGLAAPGSVVLTARTSGTSGPTWEPGISTAPPQPRQALNPCQGRGFHGHGQTSSALAEPSAGVPHNHACPNVQSCWGY
jgi:hypothetical protein